MRNYLNTIVYKAKEEQEIYGRKPKEYRDIIRTTEYEVEARKKKEQEYKKKKS